MYYAHTDDLEVRFSTEQARDEWVSRSPHSRAACDPPADVTGFRSVPDAREGLEHEARQRVFAKVSD